MISRIFSEKAKKIRLFLENLFKRKMITEDEIYNKLRNIINETGLKKRKDIDNNDANMLSLDLKKYIADLKEYILALIQTIKKYFPVHDDILLHESHDNMSSTFHFFLHHHILNFLKMKIKKFLVLCQYLK